MTPELWQQLKPLFHAALELPVEERTAFMDEACAGDVELRRHLVQLVESAQQDTGTLDAPFVLSLHIHPSRFSAGQVLLDRFRILRLIGEGGMGEVYEAEDLKLGRIALKTIRPGIAASSAALERFRQEVQTARKVTGEQVCRIHELYMLPASDAQQATAFLTMEYLDGVTLAEKLKRDGPLSLKQALGVAFDICEGLRLVHLSGIIHRDLKSANIMLRGEGESLHAVLMDFGLARDFSAARSTSDSPIGSREGASTVLGTIMGTPAYMAPEQFEGKTVSPATDIYALGIVLYELVTGQHPYAAPTPIAAAIRRAQIPERPSKLMRSVPRKWDRVIQHCLEYDQAGRYQSAEDVASALRTGPGDLVNLRKDRPSLFWLAAGLVIAAAAWGIFTFWQRMQYYHPGPEAQRWYDAGLASLHEGNNLKATRLLQQSIGKDQHFVMAHARLAEAWYDLDFQGSAQRELLVALPGRAHLQPLDARMLDAIGKTVTGDLSGAVEGYRSIRDRLSAVDKSPGDVDLGMAYERAGDIPHALEAYVRAAVEDSNNPAAYMHTGVLESRQHHLAEGNDAFERARSIFTAEIDTEGLAELDYEMGYAANDRGDSKEAEPILARSLDEAAKIPSVQLEIRALTQLSSAESNNYKDAQAVAHAQQAVQLARDNQLEPWAANGLVRLSNAQLVQLHLKEAEPPLTEAMQILKQSPQPRVQALANSTLASLMDQEHQPDKVVEPATAALAYYKQHGFSEGAFSAALLLVRYERNKGQYKQALSDGNTLLAVANQRGIAASRFQAEDAVGTVDLALEQYPDAAKHFESASGLAINEVQRSYSELHRAIALWKLGGYKESENSFKQASKNPLMVLSVDKRRVESMLSQQKYREVLDLAKGLIIKHRDLLPDDRRDLEQDKAIAEAHMGMKAEALAALDEWVRAPRTDGKRENSAIDELTASEIYLELKMPQQAADSAKQALTYFDSSGQLDSQLQSAVLETAASLSLQNEGGYASLLKKSVDIMRNIRQTWGPESSQTYLARPDIHALILRAQKHPQ
jgi:tetratricopeptide (TPR) repeat protein